MKQHRFEVHKKAKEEQGQYPAIMAEKAWLLKDMLLSFRGNFFSRDNAGSPARLG